MTACRGAAALRAAAPYAPQEVLVSLHVPKTAGSSLRHTLRGWFGHRLALHYRRSAGEPPERVVPGPGICVHGHFNRLRGIGVPQYYPDARQFITFFRNPFDRFVSQWRYLHYQRHVGIAVPELDDQPSFEIWMDRRRAAGDDPFSVQAQLPRPVRPADPDPFGPQFLFVGLVERYEASVRGLSQVLGFPPPQPTRLNTAEDAERREPQLGDFERHRAFHEAAFAQEYELYEAAARRLEAIVGRDP